MAIATATRRKNPTRTRCSFCHRLAVWHSEFEYPLCGDCLEAELTIARAERDSIDAVAPNPLRNSPRRS